MLEIVTICPPPPTHTPLSACVCGNIAQAYENSLFVQPGHEVIVSQVRCSASFKCQLEGLFSLSYIQNLWNGAKSKGQEDGGERTCHCRHWGQTGFRDHPVLGGGGGGLVRHLDSGDWFSPAEEEGGLEEEVSTLIPSPTRSHTPLHPHTSAFYKHQLLGVSFWVILSERAPW